MYPPNRIASHDDFAMFDEQEGRTPPQPAAQMFLNNPAALIWKVTNKLNYGHLSTDSLASMDSLSRNNSRDSIASADTHLPLNSPAALTGLGAYFNSWESNIQPNGENSNTENEDKLSMGESSFFAAFFKTLDAFLANHNVEVPGETPSFPKLC